jgi:hypothetical protein
MDIVVRTGRVGWGGGKPTYLVSYVDAHGRERMDRFSSHEASVAHAARLCADRGVTAYKGVGRRDG